MELLEGILTRQSVRDYTDQKISEDDIVKMLQAAMQAPSAGNQQPWQFIIFTEKEQLNALANVLPYGQSLRSAPLAIAVCGDLSRETHSGYWVQDCSAATQNLLLAAHALDLGAVWLGVYPREQRVVDVRSVLGAPESVVPLCVISIGYPKEPIQPKSIRYDQSRTHQDRW